MKRRHFLHASAAIAALESFPHSLYAGSKKLASDQVTLGPKKIKLSRLAMGTGTNGVGGSSNQTRALGLSGVADLFQEAFDHGVNFWDSADQYGSHPHLRESLKRVKRDKVVILSKTHARTASEMKADFDRFRKELNTDYLDILLLHCMMDDRWNQQRRGAMDYISELQEKGLVKTKGVSCHTLGALKTAAAEPWVEVDLARFNPAGIAMDAKPETVRPVLEQMKAQGKGIIGMKIFGAGALRGKTDECLQYALAQPFIDCFTIGSENRQEMLQLTQKIPAASVRG
jgi:aryl-alcohol dehydrogenase-like predicted oxidoreductase